MQSQNFTKRYKNLNPEQKEAVDTIEGPVLVVAGPGSGKTELLSLRIANILEKTDTLASSILCLTFTDAAANNMRQRLAGLIGKEAYKVAIHTFHSFGTEIISQNPEYFYKGAIYNPADKLLQTQILDDIFKKLKHGDPLASFHPEQGFVYLGDALNKISELKKAAITPEQLHDLLQEDKEFINKTSEILTDLFAERTSAKNLEKFNVAIEKLENINTSKAQQALNLKNSNNSSKNSQAKEPCTSSNSNSQNFPSLKEILIDSLKQAYQEAIETEKPSTKPLTQWKTKYTKKDHEKNTIFKDKDRIEKLESLANIYSTYQKALHKQGYFDFADMLLNTVQALEKYPELKYNIQEKYLYTLVDEFQDTNGVQSRLLDLIADATVNEGRPNLLAVGDDDQAIYKFQGANIQNILEFHTKYRDPKLVVLNKNYRSTQDILDLVRNIILQGEERLENIIPEINKNLISSNTKLKEGKIIDKKFEDEIQELIWISQEVKKLQKQGTKLNEIAIISKNHKHLEKVAKVLDYYDIAVSYEKKNNALDQVQIKEIITIIQFLEDTNKEALLAEILTFPFWELDRIEIWKTSAQAYKQRKNWMEIMLENPKLKYVAEFLITLSQKAKEQTAEEIIDQIVEEKYKNYYFQNLNQQYIELLNCLRSFIAAIRSYKGAASLNLQDIIKFVELHQSHKIPITYKTNIKSGQDSVNLLTAHASKGLEFQTVFALHCQENTWLSRGANDKLQFTSNLPLSATKDTIDDKLRLFYVALTRAKENLYLTYHANNQTGKENVKLRFLEAASDGSENDSEAIISSSEQEITAVSTPEDIAIEEFEIQKHESRTINETELLKTLVKNYKLSVTHFNQFLNIVDAGPKVFMQNNLLKFPRMMPASAAYGSAFHYALQFIQVKLKRLRKTPTLEEVLETFENSLIYHRLNKNDFKKMLERGQENLTIYYKEKINKFKASDLAEFDFRDQGVIINSAHITGKIDKLSTDRDKNEITVYDYKTGKAILTWEAKYDYEHIKNWGYRNQIIFYKLLIENSRTFNKYKVQTGTFDFVEPFKGKLYELPVQINSEELEQTKKLIDIVYNKITKLDFPDTSQYSKDFSGLQNFISDLLDGRI